MGWRKMPSDKVIADLTPLPDFGPLDEFLAAYDEDDNEWWRLDAGDQLNLFDLLREDRDHWRDQVVGIRAQHRAALRQAESAEAALRKALEAVARKAP